MQQPTSYTLCAILERKGKPAQTIATTPFGADQGDTAACEYSKLCRAASPPRGAQVIVTLVANYPHPEPLQSLTVRNAADIARPLKNQLSLF